MSTLKDFIIVLILEVTFIDATEVLWGNKANLNGYSFNKNESFTITTPYRTDCARSCWGVPLCTSFTYESKVKTCKGYTEEFADATHSIATENAEYYVINNVTGYTDCSDVKHKHSGIYRIFPVGIPEGLLVYCDMETDGGHWTVIQRRIDGSVDFYRTWQDYSKGFGNLIGEFYLGNEYIHVLTHQAECELRVDLRNSSNYSSYASYSTFAISSNATRYSLNVSGFNIKSHAGDSLTDVNMNKFKTFDVSDDNFCPSARHGAWWYGYCSLGNLNGKYLQPGTKLVSGIRWDTLENGISLSYADMKIRRKI
ncbi:Hypothetical predicted protein [Mytilus galloprovincialis]|uniref:Fibrinogen C-terminal domain-containing protein n=1 Tax=Mytilus galloprovincialis TaxID=29158 RepID=A0A8B6BGK6_MYTGA|nr:Hypothetical predicted protein [Mytilus galloprovincialis]